MGASPLQDLPEEPPGSEVNAAMDLPVHPLRSNVSEDTNFLRLRLTNSTAFDVLHGANATEIQNQSTLESLGPELGQTSRSPAFLAGGKAGRASLADMPLLLLLPVAGLVGVVLVLGTLVRSMVQGEVDWTRQLTSRTDWSALPGSVVKCVGPCEPVGSLHSPLAGVSCVAYSLTVAYEESAARPSQAGPDASWVTCKQSSQAATLVVRDELGAGLLVAGKECHPYSLDQVKEWYFPSGEVPEPFASWVPADVSPGRPLRFREEVLLPGSTVACVGAVSPLKAVVAGEAHACLRPAYAVMLAQGRSLDWAQLVDLGPAEWTQLAARVLVTNAETGVKPDQGR